MLIPLLPRTSLPSPFLSSLRTKVAQVFYSAGEGCQCQDRTPHLCGMDPYKEQGRKQAFSTFHLIVTYLNKVWLKDQDVPRLRQAPSTFLFRYCSAHMKTKYVKAHASPSDGTHVKAHTSLSLGLDKQVEETSTTALPPQFISADLHPPHPPSNSKLATWERGSGNRHMNDESIEMQDIPTSMLCMQPASNRSAPLQRKWREWAGEVPKLGTLCRPLQLSGREIDRGLHLPRLAKAALTTGGVSRT